MAKYPGQSGSPAPPGIPERDVPAGATGSDGLGVTTGRGKSGFYRQVDGTLTLTLGTVDHACESSLPEPGTGRCQNDPIRRSCLGIDNRDAS